MNVLEFSKASDWESWLEVEHDQQAEAWLRVGKRHSGAPFITIAEAGESALCFGWIDGHRKAYDEVSFLQRYSRRRPRTPWSKINVGRVEALIKAGRMRPSGINEVDEAKADGRWDAAYEPQRSARVPAELTAALVGIPLAAAAFDDLSRADKYHLMLPLLKAYTPETRARALARVVTRLAAQV